MNFGVFRDNPIMKGMVDRFISEGRIRFSILLYTNFTDGDERAIPLHSHPSVQGRDKNISVNQ